METSEIVNRIQTDIADVTQVMVEGADCTFSVTVLSPAFKVMGVMQRQKKVMSLFAEELASGTLHALTVKALTPEEWTNRQSDGLLQISLN